MSVENIITALSGGGLVTIIVAVMNFLNKRTDDKRQKDADAIGAWREIADERAREHTKQLERLEEKTRDYERYVLEMTEYVTALQQILLKIAPDAKLPKRPVFGNSAAGDTKT